MKMSSAEFALSNRGGYPTAARHFLFLQGLPGPAMRRLAAALRDQGHKTSRVNFNGGDIWDWRAGNTHNFRGLLDQFSAWLESLLSSQQITDIVLFGDGRPYHDTAIKRAKQLGIRTYVLEEGMLRPNFVSLEIGGTNFSSPLPRNLDALEAIAKQSSAAPDIQAVRSSVKLRTIQAVFYYVAQTIAIPFFPHYRSHRRNSPASEMRAWIVRYFGRRKEAERSRREMANLGSKPFFLFPMQIDGDFQIIRHSDFADMSGTLDCVLNNFAGNAPADANLLVKMHPFDPDIDGWRAIVADKAQRFGVGGRVYFIERYDLEPLLHAAKGLVTVNSTVGPLALAAGCPVFCLGRAVYDIGGITAQCGLNEFWSTPPKVIAENFQTFCRALQLTGLINGGFHGNRALDMLITGAAERIGADSLAPLPLSD